MSKLKKFIKSRYFPIFIASLILIIAIIAVSGYVYDSLSYRKPFYIAYYQYPGVIPSYYVYTANMVGATPSEYEGLEFIAWYYIDENGNEKEFDPAAYTPPENAEPNYLNVYGRWKSVKPEEAE